MREMIGELVDHSNDQGNSVKVRITLDNGFLSIYPEGYGENEATPGDGSPILLEFYEGRLRLLVGQNINEADKTVIDLEGAREIVRIEESDDIQAIEVASLTRALNGDCP